MISPEEYYEAIKEVGEGSLYYLVSKPNIKDEFIWEPVHINTKNKEQTINTLTRVSQKPNFIAFPGTAEHSKIVNDL